MIDDRATLALTLAPHREAVEAHPEATIKPDAVAPDAAGQRAIATLERLGPRGDAVDIRETLGQGGMGVVHLAEQVALGRQVAMKSLRAGVTGPRPTLALLQEAWVTGSLEHPNIVPVYDVGLDRDGRPYFLLKRIEGEEWRGLIRDPDAVVHRHGAADPLDWHLRVLIQVAHAVAFAHSRGVLHRDLKPTNVMIGSFGEVYVVDWGLAVALSDDHTGRLPLATAHGQLAGTPRYMAPEMARADALDERTDVYLLGGMLFEVLAGRAPHEGSDLDGILESIRTSRPQVPSDAPEMLAALCTQALDPDPRRRPHSAEAFRERLQTYLQHRGAVRLADVATERLERLEELLAGPEPDADSCYRLYGEARFGFRQSQAQCPDHGEGRRGLRRAVEVMVRFELDRGDPVAAEKLLVDADVSDVLRSELAAALAAHHEERARLGRIQRQHDPAVGQRTRWVVTVSMGFIWTVLPLLASVFGPPLEADRLVHHLAWSGIFLAVVACVFVWARESMGATALNRAVMGTVAFLYLGQVVLGAGGALLGLPPSSVLVLHIALWFAMTGVAAIAFEWRLWPAVLAMASAFLTASWHPEWVWLCMAACNGVLCLTLAVVWFPGRDRMPWWLHLPG